VIYPDDKGATQEIGAPMADCLHQADEFVLIRGDLEMASGERATEERDGASTLMQDGAKPGPDASQSMMNSLLKSGRCNTGAVDSAFLRVSNVAVAASDHWKAALRRSCVRGATMVPKSWMKRR
jgi:hypothetical protein